VFEPKLGVSLNGLTYELTEEWIEGLRESRIETLELFSRRFVPETYPNNLPMLKTLLATSRIRVSSIHADYGPELNLSLPDKALHEKAVLDYRQNVLGLAKELGVRIVVTHLSFGLVEPEQRPIRLRQARESLLELESDARQANVIMALEVLNGTAIGNTIEELDTIKAGLDEEVFGICLDFNHVMGHYAKLPEMVRGLGKRLTTVHISDYDGVTERHWFPGTGVVDWKAVMGALREIHYAGPFNQECIAEGETMQERIAGFEKSYDWLMSL